MLESTRVKNLEKQGSGGNGKSAYEIAVDNGFAGTEIQWLASLKGAKGEQGEQGIKGNKGEKGDKGNDGEDGKSFTIHSQYATYAALLLDHPTGNAGDAYFVGTDSNPDLYVWLSDTNEWYNSGKIAGVKGDKGDDGFDPSVSLTETSQGKYTITITNKSGSSATNLNFYGGLIDWAANTAYVAGDKIVYGGKIYKVTTSFTSGVIFDDTNLEAYVGKTMVGATSANEGESGLVPVPSIAARDKFLRGDGAWATPAGGTTPTESGVYATRTVLWEGKAYTVGQQLTLSDTYTNYDYIVAYASNGEVGIMHKSDTRIRLTGHGFSGETFRGTFIDFSGTTATLSATANFSQNGAYINRIEGIKFTANPNDYSTTEKVIGTWIDGKPLYQKVWTGTIVQGGVLQLSGIDKVVSFDGYIYSGSLIIPINFNTTTVEGNFTGMWAQRATSGQVTFSYEASYSHYKNVPAIITLKYTKL